MKKYAVLRVFVCETNIGDVIRAIEEAIQKDEKIYISTCPVSTIMACQRDPNVLTSVNAADIVVPDGVPVALLGRIGGYKKTRRVYGPALMQEVCKVSALKGYRHFFYGAQEHVLDNLENRLKRKFNGLLVAGRFSPPYRILSEKEKRDCVDMINQARPHIVWVGLGSPKQDVWMYENRGKIKAPVMIGVGAAFDFISGNKLQAPRFVSAIGLEWFFRLCCEPRRLWKRYLIDNSLFLVYLVSEKLGLRFYRRDV